MWSPRRPESSLARHHFPRTVVLANSESHENDIALVKLASLPNGREIDLAESGTKIPLSQKLEVTGWGATAEGGDSSQNLLMAEVPYVENDACNARDAYDGRILPGMICAGERDGGKDSCQGDSGGPLVWRTQAGPMLVGVVSFGEGCARQLKYGIYTRVSAYRKWIDTTVSAHN